MKRLFDIVVAMLALVLLAPLLALIAIAVKLDSRGPVIFSQTRVGLGGKPFSILKFRTMVNSPQGDHANVSAVGDVRVTRVGRVLRGTFLDETPQLLNVLKGDMSLVGPRPETPEHVELYTEEEREVLSMRPGMAGPSALAFHNEEEILARHEDPHDYYVNHLMRARIRLDLGYLERASLHYDIGLLLRTLVVAVLGIKSSEEVLAEHKA
jgi:lipopolysaccharide/colanic/teichoic acid biosynthesis glycosyltransferase